MVKKKNLRKLKVPVTTKVISFLVHQQVALSNFHLVNAKKTIWPDEPNGFSKNGSRGGSVSQPTM